MSSTLDVKFYLDKLVEFQVAYDFAVYPKPEDASFEVHQLRASLIHEEWLEYMRASTRLDRLDALCDLMYVVVGTAVTYSTPLKDFYEYNFPAPYAEDPIQKRINSTRPEFTELNFVVNDLRTQFPCQKNMIKGIPPLMEQIEYFAEIYLKFKFGEAFIKVHEANMNKLWQEPPRNQGELVAKPKGDRWLVTNLAGKVIKPKSWAPPQLEAYL